jgi:hypothetical protein
MIDALTPFGVFSEYSWSTPGFLAGHLVVIEKALRSLGAVIGLQPRYHAL